MRNHFIPMLVSWTSHNKYKPLTPWSVTEIILGLVSSFKTIEVYHVLYKMSQVSKKRFQNRDNRVPVVNLQSSELNTSLNQFRVPANSNHTNSWTSSHNFQWLFFQRSNSTIDSTNWPKSHSKRFQCQNWYVWFAVENCIRLCKFITVNVIKCKFFVKFWLH